MSMKLKRFFNRPISFLYGKAGQDGQHPAGSIFRTAKKLGLTIALASSLAAGAAMAADREAPITTRPDAAIGFEAGGFGLQGEYWDFVREHIAERPLTENDRIDLQDGLPYVPPSYVTEHMDMTFKLDAENTIVTAVQKIRHDQAEAGTPLRLDGERIAELLAVKIDGRVLDASEYELDDKGLTIPNVPDAFTLTIENRLDPRHNGSLFGLYETGGFLSTHNEPFGFRRITYAIDRPDVQPLWRTRIEANKADYPVLLSNGHEVERGDLEDGRHYSIWEDPAPKPSYLFAMVGGDMASVYDSYVTKTGREIEIAVHADASRIMEFRQAIDSIKRAMAFDEEVYGREYHLDNLHLVGVEDFFAGAMENTGLNIYKIDTLIGDKDTRTDPALYRIDAVIGHEYFHNWSGNRVTIRDWAHTTLKEGVTAYREQEFSAHTTSYLYERLQTIEEVKYALWGEKNSAARAVPIRGKNPNPSLGNYGMVTYVKTPEMLRMMETLLGTETFRAGLSRFFDENVTRAAVWEDLLQAMEAESGRDLGQFRKWILEAHVPEISYETSYDRANGELTISLSQTMPSFANDTGPRHVPVPVSLIGRNGEQIALELADGSEIKTAGVLDFTAEKQSFTFKNVPPGTVASVFRNHAVTAWLEHPDLSYDEALRIAQYDTDGVNRVRAIKEAHQSVFSILAATGAARAKLVALQPEYLSMIKNIINDPNADPELRIAALELPPLKDINTTQLKYDGAIATYKAMQRALYRHIEGDIQRLYADTAPSYEHEGYGKARLNRKLRASALFVLTRNKDQAAARLAFRHLNQADSMSDKLIALKALSGTDSREEQQAFDFYRREWDDNRQLINFLNRLSPKTLRPEAEQKKPAPKTPGHGDLFPMPVDP